MNRGRRPDWDASNPGNAAIREELATALLEAASPALREGRELLDAGCGTGWWLQRLLDAGSAPDRLHGLERDPDRVTAARRRAPGATVVEGDVCALPYEDRRFGAVFLVSVLSSLEPAAATAAVRETWRVLAPGGRLVVWEPRVPTPSRSTRLVRLPAIGAVTGVEPQTRTLTLAPPLARRLGPHAVRWYPRLVALRGLRTHRLAVWTRPDGSLIRR
jgi:ubiquinone/menaquinone biosynthesis C-methylase UbiE